MDEKASLLNISLSKSFVPERKSMIVIIHDPCWYSCIFQENKMLESFSSDNFSTHFSLDNCFCRNLNIIQSSCDETRYDNRMTLSLVPIQTIVGDSGRNDMGYFIHISKSNNYYRQFIGLLYGFIETFPSVPIPGSGTNQPIPHAFPPA